MYSDMIFRLRKERHMSRQALADLVGLSPTAIYKWETGESQPNIEALTLMARYFGVTLDELCGLTDSQSSQQNERIRVMTRAFSQLSPEEQDRLLAVGRAMYGSPFPRVKG